MNSKVSGFALPTVLVAGLLSMMVLMVALTASSGIRSALDDQYYQQLAREAAESGILYAQTCLSSNGYISQWAGKTLTPKTNCLGNNISSYPNNLSQSGNIETTFVVSSLAATLDPQFITVTGIVNIKRATDGSVWKTIEHVQRAQTSSEIGIGSIAFGYQYVTMTSPQTGVFFATIGRDGTVHSLGQNYHGQLGHGDTVVSTEPSPFIMPDDVRVKKMFANFLSAGRALFAVTYDGDVYAAGLNDEGQLGLGHVTSPISTPQKIPGLPAGDPVIHVDSISNATFIITQSGKIYTSGTCTNGSLGTGTTCTDRTTMTRVNIPSTQYATEKFVTDRKSAYVITQAGWVYGWGENAKGQLGNGNYTNQSNPVRMGSSYFNSTTPATKLAFDGQTIYVLRSDGLLYASGNNEDYEMASTSYGTGVNTFRNITSHIPCTGKIIDIVTDRSHVAILTDTGQVCTWGRDSQGQLGHDTAPAARKLPKRVDNILGLPSGVKVVGVAANAVGSTTSSYGAPPNNTYLVTSDGRVYGAGSNYRGQLGTGGTIDAHSFSQKFVRMNVFGPSEPAAKVQSGNATTVIYTKSGRVYTVGNNAQGQLGDGTTTNSSTPKASRYTNVGPPIFF